MNNTKGNEPTTDEFGHRVPTRAEMNEGPANHIRLEDAEGEIHDLPLVDECCGDYEVVFEETPHGPMERCSTCGDYV